LRNALLQRITSANEIAALGHDRTRDDSFQCTRCKRTVLAFWSSTDTGASRASKSTTCGDTDSHANADSENPGGVAELR